MNYDIVTLIFVAVITTALGVGVGLLIDSFRTQQKLKKEMEENNNIDITGDDWFAAWQTSVEMEEVLNTERLSLKQKGHLVKMRNFEKSPENPKGGYLWEAQMQFFHGKILMGWYFPIKGENNASKGMMFFTYHSARKLFFGKWVGSAYDGDLVNGFVVISKDKQKSLSILNEIIKKHPDKINIIYDSF